jgi:toxin ParE1/3/4
LTEHAFPLFIEWSPLASQDRRYVFDFIEADRPLAAIDIDRRIVERVEYLKMFPETGGPGRVTGTRELVISGTPYLAAYRLTSSAIVILRTLHGAQQWPVQL